MGDARNKIPRMEHDARIREGMRRQLARDAAHAAANPLPTCLCGHNWYQAHLWSGGGLKGLRCLGCWPNDVEKPPGLA